MNATPRILSFLLIFVVLQSCKDHPHNPKEARKGRPDRSVSRPEIRKVAASTSMFPQTGTRSSDFLPASGLYAIQYEAEGDLNRDGLADKALVLHQQDNNTAERAILILLQAEDRTYRLDKISWTALLPESDENGYPRYTDEAINIKDNRLQIELYSIGPYGNLFSQFQYVQKDLIMTTVEAQNMGAGSQQTLVVDLLSGEFTQEVTLTLDDDMPSDSQTITRKPERHGFESASPDAVVKAAYQHFKEED